MGEKRNVYRILVGKPEGKGPLGRPRCKWEDTTEKYFTEIGWGVIDWIDLVHDMDMWWALANN
jgi:hypothetical protein